MSAELHRVAAARLGQDGQRYTTNRRDLVDVLHDERQPMTIPEILARRRDLAQSSVYRNLSLLERAGVVVRVVTNSEWGRYELAQDLTGHHHHLVCSACGLVRDVELPEHLEHAIDRLLGELSTESGFVIEEHRFDLLGRCRACLNGVAS
jgi:Fur family transcriptional regulator, ferric uptake regulator